MEKISTQLIKQLREMTGVGMQDAQQALVESGGDLGKAQDNLRKKGVTKAAKKASRTAKEGVIESYLHGTKVGVLIEVNCETDFVAKTDDFRTLAHELALQVAGASPRFVSRDQVPDAVLDAEKAIYTEQVTATGKPAEIIDKIVAGKMEKFFEEACLMDQPTVKDPKKKVSELIHEAIAKMGENIVVARFSRYQLGE